MVVLKDKVAYALVIGLVAAHAALMAGCGDSSTEPNRVTAPTNPVTPPGTPAATTPGTTPATGTTTPPAPGTSTTPTAPVDPARPTTGPTTNPPGPATTPTTPETPVLVGSDDAGTATCVAGSDIRTTNFPEGPIGTTGATVSKCVACTRTQCSETTDKCASACKCSEAVHKMFTCMATPGSQVIACGAPILAAGPEASGLGGCVFKNCTHDCGLDQLGLPPQ